jgi:hypothetical protein
MSNAVATYNAAAAVNGSEAAPDADFALLQRQARLWIASGLLPKEINTPEKAVTVVMKGRELRIPPMYALSNIVVVNGKPTCSAELMLALIHRDYGQRSIRIKESTNASCTVEWRQEGWDGTQHYTFTLKDADTAGLLTNPTWKKYPAAMLRARCVSAVARMGFPECIGGMYGAEELGADVIVTDDGEVMVAHGTPTAEVIDVETGEILDAPVPTATNGPEAPAPNPPPKGPRPGGMTSPQSRKLWVLARERGLDEAGLHVLAQETHDVTESLWELSVASASELIDWLEQTPREEVLEQVGPLLRQAEIDVGQTAFVEAADPVAAAS